MTETFCRHLIEEMENLNDWSNGKNEVWHAHFGEFYQFGIDITKAMSVNAWLFIIMLRLSLNFI